MPFSIELLTLFFFAAMIAGCIDAIAGGGGLITIPALLMCGVPPAQAIASNKVGAIGGSMSSTIHFVRRGHIDLNSAKLMIASSFVGSFLGSMLLTRIDSSFLAVVIPFLLIGFSLYFLFSPNLGALDRKHLISGLVYSLFVASVIGFYDGFFGPGTGAFFAISFTLLLGYNLIKATAYAKLLNFCSNLAALIYFIMSGSIIWEVGIAMFLGQIIGGAIGARLVVKNGQMLIKIAMVVMTIGVSIKMLALDS